MGDTKDSFAFRNERPWPNRRMKRGVIVGHTTETSARLWIRTAEPGDYALFLAPIAADDADAEKRLNATIDQVNVSQDDLSRAADNLIQRKFSIADYENDTTRIEDVTDLIPGQRYRYFVGRLEKDERWRIVIDAIPRSHARQAQKRRIKSAGLNFHTLSAEGESFRFGLFSCHNPFSEVKQYDGEKRVEVQGMDAWDSMSITLERHAAGTDGNLAFVIAGGDQCYTDGRETISIWKYLYKVMRRENGKLLPEEDTMMSWFRDIYRAYWGFPQVRAVYGLYPTYMIWDDHEIGDGWGSFGPGEHPIYAQIEDKPDLAPEDGDELLRRMFTAAKRVYEEYEHSHNPPTAPDQFHYHFRHRDCQFYVLDGRGQRDINREKNRILGDAQLKDFIAFVNGLDDKTPFLFVVSAVPFVHTASLVVGAAGALKPLHLEDDLKDAWEHTLHDEERAAIMECLWAAAKKGVRICVLSGDVHASALFKIVGKTGGVIYQITSSAITYHMPRFHKWIARLIVADDGKTRDGDSFDRRAFQSCPSFALVKVAPEKKQAWLSMYDASQKVILTDDGYGNFKPENEGREIPMTHSLGRHELHWD